MRRGSMLYMNALIVLFVTFKRALPPNAVVRSGRAPSSERRVKKRRSSKDGRSRDARLRRLLGHECGELRHDASYRSRLARRLTGTRSRARRFEALSLARSEAHLLGLLRRLRRGLLGRLVGAVRLDETPHAGALHGGITLNR